MSGKKSDRGRRPGPRALALGAIVVAVALVGLLAIGPWGGQATPSTTSGHAPSIPQPTGSASTPENPTATLIVTSLPTSGPLAAHGWPIYWQEDGLNGQGFDLEVSPDGTVYVSESGKPDLVFALDAIGHERKGWLRLPDGKSLAPAAFGADGSIYVLEPVGDGLAIPSGYNVFAFNSNGSLRFTRSVVAPLVEVLPTPSGGLYVEADYDNAKSTLTLLGPDGSVRNSASVDQIGLSGVFVRPDDNGDQRKADQDGEADQKLLDHGAHSPGARRTAAVEPPADWSKLSPGATSVRF